MDYLEDDREYTLQSPTPASEALTVHLAAIWDEAQTRVGRNLPRHRRNGTWIRHAIERGDY